MNAPVRGRPSAREFGEACTGAAASLFVWAGWSWFEWPRDFGPLMFFGFCFVLVAAVFLLISMLESRGVRL